MSDSFCRREACIWFNVYCFCSLCIFTSIMQVPTYLPLHFFTAMPYYPLPLALYAHLAALYYAMYTCTACLTIGSYIATPVSEHCPPPPCLPPVVACFYRCSLGSLLFVEQSSTTTHTRHIPPCRPPISPTSPPSPTCMYVGRDQPPSCPHHLFLL